MPASQYEKFEIPENQKIWRYMNLRKFESLLAEKALFFASATQFEDVFEGSITKHDHERAISQLAPDLQHVYPRISSAFKELTRLTKICCWHANQHESEGMWKLYLGTDDGVAIQSTTTRLLNSIGEYRIQPEYGSETVHVGKVRYLDYQNEPMEHSSMLDRFFYKRVEFAAENEIRAAVSLRLAEEYGVSVPDKGILVPVDLAGLIERVILPNSKPELADRISAMLRAAGLSTIPQVSAMRADPTF